MIIVKSKYFVVLSGESDEDVIRKVKSLYGDMIGNSVLVAAMERLLKKVMQIDGIVGKRFNYNWSTSISDAQSVLAWAARTKSSAIDIIPGESAQDFAQRVEATFENFDATMRDALEDLLAKAMAVNLDGPLRHNWSDVIDYARSVLAPSGGWTASLPKRVYAARVELRRALGLPPLIKDPRPPWPA